MAAAVERDDDDDWQVVRSVRATDPAKRTGRSVGKESGTIQGSRPEIDSATNYQHLIGACIKKESPEIGGVNRESEIRSRIGGILHLPSRPVVSQGIHSNLEGEEWDLGSSSEWPSVGWKGSSAPQLTSWNAVVKKPPTVLRQKRIDEVRIIEY